MQRLLGIVITVQLLAGAAAVVIDNLPARVERVPVLETKLRPNQVEVKGTAFLVKAGPTTPGEPLTLPVTIRGSGATISNALVADKRSTIVWDGGRPLVIEGSGSIDLASSAVVVDAGGEAPQVTWLLDGAARAIAPGVYRIKTPVAVGTAGLATPRDSVTFTADASTRITTRGNAQTATPLKPMTLNGPGRLELQGDLRRRLPDDDAAAPSRSETFEGSYRVDITPGPPGVQVVALYEQG